MRAEPDTPARRAELLLADARALVAAGDLDTAGRALDEALQIGRRHDLPAAMAPVQLLASQLAEQRGDLAAALRHFQQFHMATLATLASLADQTLTSPPAMPLASPPQDLQSRSAAGLPMPVSSGTPKPPAEAPGPPPLLDALTGLADRRQLDAVLARRHTQALGDDLPLCLALINLDRLQAVNDQHGRSVGDQVLQQLARLLQAHCRDNDLPARLGSDNFVMLITGVGPMRARAVCNRLRQLVQAHTWWDIAPGLAMTVSIGVCDIGRDASPAAGLARVEYLLAQAKQAGRNRVQAADA